MTGPTPVAGPAADVLRRLALAEGVCIRPVLHRVTDTVTGDVASMPLPCGATLTAKCPPCAERNRRLRMQQCREGWHLAEEPDQDQDDEPPADPDPAADSEEEAPAGRRHRSTRRRADTPDLPRLPVSDRTVGCTFTGSDGKTWRPSTFLTVTLPSYGSVSGDGTPTDPDRYDYRRAALDALHLPKLFDRFVQNLRRAVGYDVQYFAAVEPQRRLAPHIHMAIRGAIPRALLRRVITATYHHLWWPPHDRPVYTGDHLPVWSDRAGCYVDPDSHDPLPTWAEAVGELDDEHAQPAHLLRFGRQHDIQGLIANSESCDRRIGYLTKYLSKSIAEGMTGDDVDPTPVQAAHVARLYAEVVALPCSPECPNWLAYGVAPKNAVPGLRPGRCTRKAHDRDRLGCGGRRVLVSRKWTGKTLDQHRADRRDAVRQVLAATGVTIAEGYTATERRADGELRWLWERLEPREEPTAYIDLIAALITQRQHWRVQYEAAKEAASNSATEEAA